MFNDFDYKGLSPEYLFFLCDEKFVNKGVSKWKYWTSEVYSYGKILREYAFYPKFLPIYCYSSHGVYFSSEKPFPHELENDSYAQFYTSPDSVSAFKKFSKKKCYCVISPFVWYRRRCKILRNAQSRGTIAFPSHSTPDIDVVVDMEHYADELLSLDKEYHPVCVCLHMHDINKNVHDVFLRKGIPVYTAGNAADIRFAERWYDIVRNFSYSTSNMIGSYSFYSVEMGIPFFICGDRPLLLNNSDANIPIGTYFYEDTDHYSKAMLFFKDNNDVAAEDRLKFVEYHLGVYDSIGRVKVFAILVAALFKDFVFFKDIKMYIGKKIDILKRKLGIGASRLVSFLQFAILKYFSMIKCGLSIVDLFRLFMLKNVRTFGLLGKRLRTNSGFWTAHGISEIFIDKIYKFRNDNEFPRIIDCGANIGLSTIFFKTNYPNSQVIAIEADPESYSVLCYNVKQFYFDNVSIVNSAVWIDDEGVNFNCQGGVSGKICAVDSGNVVFSKSLRLKEYLSEQVDFLKIDIEGAEYKVLEDCKDVLDNVKNIFVEYHSEPNSRQTLHEILAILSKSGFRYYLKEAWVNQANPYLKEYVGLFDLQINIFGYRI